MVTDDEILMPGYSCVRWDRQRKAGGGVAIYCRDSINFTVREDLNNANEAVWIQVNRKNCIPFVVGCIYRPPDQPINNFGKISAQPHTTLCIQFLDRENNDKNNTLPLGKQICLTIVWGCAEILPQFY